MMKNLFTLCIIICIISCRKDSFITSSDAVLNLSEDSLYFDTLFTSTGSVTQYFKIFNDNNRKLKINTISLAGGNNSYFKINADGVPGPVVSNLEMEANDSLYVFVTVKIDPSTGSLPYIVEDSINIDYNGNSKKIKLSAWGQNANFLRSLSINSNSTFTNQKPYVILGRLSIAEGVQLTIQKGARIFLHADAPLFVNGTLVAIGEKYDSTTIIFQGDRLDAGYKDYPGAWPGIYFSSTSNNNILKHVIIKNAYQGIVADKAIKLNLEDCIVDNCYDAGVIGSRSNIEAVNCVISNCGKNIMLLGGGNYSFKHCTNVAISNDFIQHKDPGLTITDFIRDANNNIITGEVNVEFINGIIWGSNGVVSEEVVQIREGTDAFNVEMGNTLVNIDPLFVNIDSRERIFDYHLAEGSPAIGAGTAAGVLKDIEETDRKLINPDLGAYESTF
jgi:hypothetical protein